MKRWVIILAVLAGLFLAPGISYCQQLTDKEKEIFYQVVEWEMKLPEGLPREEAENAGRKIATDLGITYEQLQDIMQRGYSAPLDEREEEVAQELENMLSVYGEYPPMDKIAGASSELAAKYRMTVGQVESIYFRSGEED